MVRGRGAPHTAVEVALEPVDDVAPSRDDAHSADAAPRATGPGPRRSPWRLVAGTVVVALVGVVVGVNVAERRELAERRAELAAIPGVLPDALDAAWEDVWMLPGDWDWVLPAAEVLVAGTWAGEVAGVDQATGAVRWRVDAADAWCAPLAEPFLWYPETAGLTTTFAPGTATRTLACSGEAGVETFDLRTGERLAGLSTQAQGAVALVDEPGATDELVVVATGADGTPELMRWSARTGEVLWSRDVTASLPDRPAEPWGWSLEVHGGVVALFTDRTLAVDLEDGSELDVSLVPWGLQRRMAHELEDGAFVTEDFGERGPLTAVREPDGTMRASLDGGVLVPTVRDAGSRDLVLAGRHTGTLSAMDAGTGEVLWSRQDLAPETATLALDGRVVVTAAGRTYALDVRDGSTVWEVATTALARSTPVTDGTHVLLAERDRDERANHLVARRLDDGSEVWRTPLAAGTSEVGSAASLVVRSGSAGLVASRPDGWASGG